MKYKIFSFFLIFGLVLATLVVSIVLKKQYFNQKILNSNQEFFINTNTTFNQLMNKLDTLSINLHPIAKAGLNMFAKQKRLDYWFEPGRYVLKESYSMNDVINKLRSRSQDPINVTFNSMDDISDVFGIIGNKLELDSIDLVNYLDSTQISPDSLYFSFIPNTYELFWDISPETFINRMHTECKKFWTTDRSEAAE